MCWQYQKQCLGFDLGQLMIAVDASPGQTRVVVNITSKPKHHFQTRALERAFVFALLAPTHVELAHAIHDAPPQTPSTTALVRRR